MQTVMAEHCTDTSERVTCPAMKHQIGWHFGHVQRQSGHVYLQNRGLWECAFCTPLYIFSVLTYALIGKKKTNDKTQLSASFPWGVQNQKTKTKKTKKKNNKTKKKEQENQDDLQGQSACDIGLFFFCFWFFLLLFLFCFLLFFLFFFGFLVFLFLLVLVTFDLLEVLLALSQIFQIKWGS